MDEINLYIVVVVKWLCMIKTVSIRWPVHLRHQAAMKNPRLTMTVV